MLRTTRMIGPELAKYYVFTGATLGARDAQELGIVTKLVAPAEVDDTVQKLVFQAMPDKYRSRSLPDRFQPLATVCNDNNVTRLLSGTPPQGISEELAARTARLIGQKAPLALKASNEIIDRQAGTSIEEAVEIELGGLEKIFSTADALEGLSSLGRKRPEFKGE
jgi:enoyl-CoA hydratase/3-hydroxyacyl-CoA dehydrogenase